MEFWAVFLISAVSLCVEVSLAQPGYAGVYPRESETRQTKSLDGMWSFRIDNSTSRHEGFDKNWASDWLSKSGPVMAMPVPSSYNDIGTESQLRDFVGWAWYDTSFYVDVGWKERRVMLRFGSVHYYAVVWVNGKQAVTHTGGHLPFEVEVNDLVTFDGKNRVTVAVNNTLTPITLPPGKIEYMGGDPHKPYPPGYFVQVLQMDFFNYAGIHRPVLLYSTPRITCLWRLDIQTEIINQTTGVLLWEMIGKGSTPPGISVEGTVLDRTGTPVGAGPRSAAGSSKLVVPNAHLWWPWTMNTSDAGYLYDLEVVIKVNSTLIDVYRQPFGFRTVSQTSGGQLLINGRPFYCQGFGKHEDSAVRGKGVDLPTIARDFELMKWSGANCFRTSHYPYAEEIMEEADRRGFAVIDESPGVGIKEENLKEADLLSHHKDVMREMIERDKNHPSVIMWSIANEPASSAKAAKAYFEPLFSLVRSLDKTRPVTFVIGPSDYYKEQVAQLADVLCINKYYGWYSDLGHLEVITDQLLTDLIGWRTKFNKSIIITEYGADTIPGFYSLPSSSFTEDYQIGFMAEYHRAFDKLKSTGALTGEMAWNFADFMTIQQINRAYGNRKGVFTRDRQPKPSAHFLRQRYHSLLPGGNE